MPDPYKKIKLPYKEASKRCKLGFHKFSNVPRVYVEEGGLLFAWPGPEWTIYDPVAAYCVRCGRNKHGEQAIRQEDDSDDE